MNGTLIIARREIAEKKFIFLTALALAVVPFASALLPMRQMVGPQGVMVSVAVGVGTAFALGLAVVLGATMVGRELGERRLSFYFSRPVSAASIWFGKLSASLFMTLACLAIIVGPALLLAGNAWDRSLTGERSLVIAGVTSLAILLLLLSHLVSTAIRARSPLVAVDFVLAVATAAAVFYLFRPLYLGLAFQLINRLGLALLAAFALAVVAAGAWQLADGRTDRKRSYATMARVFWGVVGGTLLVAAGFVTWIVSAKPTDLVDGRFQQAPQGNWAFIEGKGRHRGDFRSGFLYDLDTHRWMRISGGDIAFGGGSFNRSGTVALMQRFLDGGSTQEVLFRSRMELVLLPLDGAAKPVETGLTFSMPHAQCVLSDDGRRVVYFDRGLLSVYDLAAKRSLVSIRLPVMALPKMFFVTPDKVRFYVLNEEKDSQRAARAYELDVPKRAVTKTGEARMTADALGIIVSNDGSTAVLRSFLRAGGGTSITVADARTLVPSYVYKVEDGVRVGSASPLADGTLLITETRAGGTVARVIGRNGLLLREIPLGVAGRAFLSAELPGNKVVLAGPPIHRPGEDDPWGALVLDVDRGVIVRRAAFRLAVIPTFDWATDPRCADPLPRILSGADGEGRWAAWNPETGAAKRISGF